jgi:hypothetical protein
VQPLRRSVRRQGLSLQTHGELFYINYRLIQAETVPSVCEF